MRNPAIIALIGGCLVMAGKADLPPVRADLAGILRMERSPMTLPWKVEVRSVENGSITLAAALNKAEGATFDVHLEIQAPGKILWRIEDAKLDLGVWWPEIRKQLQTVVGINDWSASGWLSIQGQGSWLDGMASGEIALKADNLSLVNLAQDLSIDGVALQLFTDDMSDWSLQPEQSVSVNSIEAQGQQLKQISAKFGWGGMTDQTVSVKSLNAQAYGGSISLEPFDINLGKPEIPLVLHLQSLSLHQLVTFVPEFLQDALGRVHGNVQAKWSSEEGLMLQGGQLKIQKTDTASIRLASQPGLLTGHLGSPGFFGKLFSPLERTRFSLEQIELGKVDLGVDSMQVVFMPDGPDGLRSATVQIHSQPKDPKNAAKSVAFEVNIYGPLNQILKFQMNQNFSFDLSTK